MNFTDSLQNLTANIGTSRDKASHAEYARPTNISSLQAEYLAAFEYAWLPRRIVSQVAQDAFRKWREWQADAKQITLIEKEEKRLDARNTFEAAYQDARLRGVAYVHIAIKGDTDLSQPLNPDRVRRGGIEHLTRLSRDDVAEGDIDLDPLSPTYGMPRYYEIAASNLARVHPSRMVIFYGDRRPTRFAGGVEANSILAASMPAIKRHDSIVANVSSLVYEARVDVITVPGLANLLDDEVQYDNLIARFLLMAQMKGNNGIVLLNGSEAADTPSETWEQKNSTFTTLPDLIEKAQEEVSAAARIPRAILFGTGAGGLGATGNLELSSYYDHINTLQTNEVEPSIYVFDECLIRSALGSRPDDIWYTWASLWQMSDEQKAEIGDKIPSKWQTIAAMSAIPQEALTQALINDLTESGMGGGIEQAMDDWVEAGGMDEPVGMGDAAPRTLYVYRKVKNAEDIIEWAHDQGFSGILDADDLHVTIAYSRSPVDWMRMGQSWGDDLEIDAGGPRVVEPLGMGAKALLFAHHSLYWRNKEMREFGASFDYDEYQPHITITYEDMPDDVEPYRGKIILGPEIFEEVE